MMASGERLASAFRRARGEDAIEGGAEADLGVAEWAKLDLSEFTCLPEYETIRQVIDEKLSREGIRLSLIHISSIRKTYQEARSSVWRWLAPF